MSLKLQFRNKKNITSKDKYIWKYLDLHKYISFLINPTFYLRRLDLFDDIMEGKSHQEIFEHTLNTIEIDNPESDLEQMIVNIQKSNMGEDKVKVDSRYACCFFLGSHESMAMWNIYSKAGSVALKYDPSILSEFLEMKMDEQPDIDKYKRVVFSKVTYTDFLKPVKVQDRAFRKNNSYRHEQEVRLMIELKKVSKEIHGIEYKTNFPPLSGLEVIAHPATPKWQFENLNNITTKYQPNYSLTESMLKNTLRYGAGF